MIPKIDAARVAPVRIATGRDGRQTAHFANDPIELSATAASCVFTERSIGGIGVG